MDENEWGKYVKILPMSENIALLHWVMDDLINLILKFAIDCNGSMYLPYYVVLPGT